MPISANKLRKELTMDRLFSLFKQIEKDKVPTEPVSHIIVGLGNPGDKYKYTRHNAGFLALSYISQKLNTDISKSKFKGLYTEVAMGGKRALLLLPQTFMNLSGEAVRAAMDFYKIPIENVLVIFDDVSLSCGKLRIRKSGSAGGHNGLKSIIEHAGSDAFPRIKIGVGEKPHPEMDLADWVLSSFTSDEQKTLFDKFENVYKAAELIVKGDITSAMNNYNG